MNVGLPPSMFILLGRKFMPLQKSQLPSEARAFLLYSYLLQCSSCLRLNSCTSFHTLLAHGKSHADELQHSDLFPNLGITPTSKRVRLNLLGTSQVVQGLDTQDYHLPSFNLTTNLSSLGLGTSQTSPWPPSPNFHSSAPMWLMSVVKPKVKPNPTLKLVTQDTTRATHSGPDLGLDQANLLT